MHSSNMRELETTITEVVGLARLFCLPLIYVRRKGPLEAQRQRHWAWERSSFQRTDTSSFSIIFVVLSCSPFEVLQCFQPVLSVSHLDEMRECDGCTAKAFDSDIEDPEVLASMRPPEPAQEAQEGIEERETHWKNMKKSNQCSMSEYHMAIWSPVWYQISVHPFPCRTRLPRHWQILLKLEITLRILILVVKVQLHCRSTKLVCTVVRKTTLPYLAYFDTSLNWPGPSSLQFQMGRVIMSRFKIILWNCGAVIKPYPIRLFYSLDGRVNSEVGHSQVKLPCFPSKLWHQVMPCLVLKKHKMYSDSSHNAGRRSAIGRGRKLYRICKT